MSDVASESGVRANQADVDGPRLVRELRDLDHAHGQLTVAWDYGEWGGPGSEDGVRSLLNSIGYPQELVHIHKGWFREHSPRDAGDIDPIALLHLDGDLYESTRVCLEYLYDSLVPGGFVNINDYGTYEGCLKAVDEFRNQLDPKLFLAHVNQAIRYWVKPG